MKFGEVIEALRDGKHRAYRERWNGIRNNPDEKEPRMFIFAEVGGLEYPNKPLLKWIENKEEHQYDIGGLNRTANLAISIEKMGYESVPDAKTMKKKLNEADKVNDNQVIGIQADPYFCLYTTDKTVVKGWLASQSDLFADDWKVVEE